MAVQCIVSCSVHKQKITIYVAGLCRRNIESMPPLTASVAGRKTKKNNGSYAWAWPISNAQGCPNFFLPEGRGQKIDILRLCSTHKNLLTLHKSAISHCGGRLGNTLRQPCFTHTIQKVRILFKCVVRLLRGHLKRIPAQAVHGT